ncbi:MAG: hypothetical protein KAS67_06845 [Thermoplasmata archaeon]|nr:hypothetical protein [Thermoplasmata archaeon]
MSGKTEMKKILAMAVMTIMVCASLVIVSPNNTVTAEDSAKPFVDLNSGYPLPSDVLDQEQTLNNDLHGIYLEQWYSQTFIPSTSGPLSKVSVYIWNFFGSGDLNCEIWTTDASHHPLAYLTGKIIVDGTIPGSYDDWYDIEFSSPATLSSGVEYTIVMWCTDDKEYDWRCWGTDIYPNGGGYESITYGASWSTMSKDFCFKTYMDNGANGLKKVAWHSSGDYALAVTGADDSVWRYDRSNQTWWLLGQPDSTVNFTDIIYSDNWNRFFLVGENHVMLRGHSYSYDGSFVNLLDSPQNGKFLGVEECEAASGYYFLAVGEAMNGSAMASWNNGAGSYVDIVSGFNWAELESIKDCTWNYRTGGSSNHYAIGWNNTGKGFVYRFGSPGMTMVNLIYITDSNGDDMDVGNTISWCPGYYKSAAHDYALIGNEGGGSFGNVYKFSDAGPPILISEKMNNIKDLAWRPDGEIALIIGNDGPSVATLAMHYVTMNDVDDLDSILPGGTEGFWGVDMKGFSSPSSGIIVGSSGGAGFYPSAIYTGTTITVNAAFPHSFDIDLWKTNDAGRLSKLNNQLLLETTYTFFTEINYTISGIDQFYVDIEDDVRVDLSAWYDEGATPSNAPVADDQHRTRMFNATWSEGGAPGTDTAVMTYPIGSPGTNEFLMDSWWYEPGPGDHHYIYFNITIGPQTWAADGTGFANGAASDINFANQALEDPNSWDFEMRVYDVNFAGATNSSYEEFGTFMFTNVTVSGNPAGNAPPGSSTQLGPNSQITCSANIPYYLNVSIPDLPRLGGGLPIPATYISVNTTSTFATDVNSEIFGVAVPFPGANKNLSIWGNRSQAAPGDWVVPAPLNSTTAHGPQGEDFQGLGATEIEWYVTVPGGTAEGIYQATITFRIGFY